MSEGPNTPHGSGGSSENQPPPPGQGQTPPPPGAGQNPPPAPQAPQGQASPGIGDPADLMTRVLARLIDAIILFIVNMVVVTTLVVGALFGGSAGFFGGFSLPGLIGSVISAAIYVGYFALLESNRGQTVGKMLMKVQVQGPDGQNPTMEQALKRNAWMALSIIPLLGGLLQLAAAIYIIVTINNNTQTRQGWHDEFAGGTKVIKIG